MNIICQRMYFSCSSLCSRSHTHSKPKYPASVLTSMAQFILGSQRYTTERLWNKSWNVLGSWDNIAGVNFLLDWRICINNYYLHNYFCVVVCCSRFGFFLLLVVGILLTFYLNDYLEVIRKMYLNKICSTSVEIFSIESKLFRPARNDEQSILHCRPLWRLWE